MREVNDDFMVGDIQVSAQHNTLMMGDAICRLQPKVMAVLQYLAKNSDRVISNDELLDNVWKGRVVTHSSIQKSVNALRSAFKELDEGHEYVAHFAKRGYQLVEPVDTRGVVVQEESVGEQVSYTRNLAFCVIGLLVLVGAYLIYVFAVPSIMPRSPAIAQSDMPALTQVKPYASNSGLERLFEPSVISNKLAFIRTQKSDSEESEVSKLIVVGANAQEWQVSVAQGRFTDLAWSSSGRNLVALDAHSEGGRNYVTFHIFTLDFKGEKVIEKNLLSYWLGKVRSVAWLDERVLEFVATQGNDLGSGSARRNVSKGDRYRYRIADQNLTKLTSQSANGELMASVLTNKKVAVLSQVASASLVEFFDQHQVSIAQSSLPFIVLSMSWLVDDSGVLLLSEGNRLFILTVTGELHSVDYSPKINGRITRSRMLNKGSAIVLTVEAEQGGKSYTKEGGGFIYSAAPSNNHK